MVINTLNGFLVLHQRKRWLSEVKSFAAASKNVVDQYCLVIDRSRRRNQYQPHSIPRCIFSEACHTEHDAIDALGSLGLKRVTIAIGARSSEPQQHVVEIQNLFDKCRNQNTAVTLQFEATGNRNRK